MSQRTYGSAPFNVAVIHGGPGAPGEMAPVARELSGDWGVLEPLQTATSLEGQLEELRVVLEKHGDTPVTLVGHSWGAWLSFILAARRSPLVSKLILIGSGPFEEEYATSIMETRLSRLSEEERREVRSLVEALDDPAARDKNTPFAQLGKLISRADSYDPLSDDSEALEYRYGVYESVWPDARELRRSGELLELGNGIQCPVVAIHGDCDPHPCAGVREPLSRVLKDFRFIKLENCGHYPWLERDARQRFFEILKGELPRDHRR